MIYKNILETIGKTPIVELQKQKSKAKALYVKIESFNPTGSVKDRPALHMIETAEKRGLLKKGMTIVEATSGNMGIGMAMVGAIKGYSVVFTMPESMSVERRKLFEAYGAKCVLTLSEKCMTGALAEAKKLAKNENYFMPSQFENFDNSAIHEKTTAQEIWDDTGGDLDAIIVGVGTGGTISGVGKYWKNKNPKTKIIAIEPQNSPMISKGKSGSHKIQGIGANFIPKILDLEILDETFHVSDESAMKMQKKLAKEEGIFGGISTGAVVSAMLELSQREVFSGKKMLAILPDTGERYLSML